MASRNPMPTTEPPAAGNQPAMPISWASSMAGMSRDHILAAIITPAAKPSMIRCSAGEDFWRNKKTTAAPRAVIKAVNPVPTAAHNSASNTTVASFLKTAARGLRLPACAFASRIGYAVGQGRVRPLQPGQKDFGRPVADGHAAGEGEQPHQCDFSRHPPARAAASRPAHAQ